MYYVQNGNPQILYVSIVFVKVADWLLLFRKCHVSCPKYFHTFLSQYYLWLMYKIHRYNGKTLMVISLSKNLLKDWWYICWLMMWFGRILIFVYCWLIYCLCRYGTPVWISSRLLYSCHLQVLHQSKHQKYKLADLKGPVAKFLSFSGLSPAAANSRYILPELLCTASHFSQSCLYILEFPVFLCH